MSKIALNFYGEIISVEKPQSLEALRKEIARLFCFSAQDASEILLTYNENGDKLIISSEEDLKAFLDSKNSMIDLDISQNSKIYKDNLNQLKEETLKDKTALEELLKKREELIKIKESQIISDKEEIKKIQSQIMELWKQKASIRKKMFENVCKIDKEKREIDQKIEEIQKKLGISVTKPEEKMPKMEKMWNPNMNFFPFMQFPHPFFHKQNFFKQFPHQHNHRPHHHKKPFGVKFGKTEFIDIPKEPNRTMTETNESLNDLDLKIKTIDGWGKCLLTKTHEITNKLAETFKGFPPLNLSLNTEADKNVKNKENQNEKVIHHHIICDGCGMRPLMGKRYKCKGCADFDYCEKCYEKNKETHKHEFLLIEKPEFRNPFFFRRNPYFHHYSKRNTFKPENTQKKMEHCKTMGNIFEKEKISNKIMHFGVKCDGCGAFPIVGCRFKCAVCPDFDYCEECEKKLSEKHNHPFLKIYEPKMNPVFFNCKTKK